MSAALKKPAPAVVAASEEDGAVSPLLDQILTEMNTLAQRTTRVSPIRLRSFEDLERFADYAAKSSMVPKDFIGKPYNCLIAVQLGSELGLAPMQSLQNIAVINGRPSVWGDALPGLCRASGMMAYMREWSEGTGENLEWHCETARKDDVANPVKRSFSVAQARTAGLWGGSVWGKYPDRMLQMRARGFALRDAFPDVLKGLITAEEATDISLEEAGISLPSTGQRLAERPEQPASPTATPTQEPAPRKRTWSDLLDEIEARFQAAQTRNKVDEVLASPEVQKALDGARNGARERLDAIIRTAMERTPVAVENAPEHGPTVADAWTAGGDVTDEIPF